MQKDTEWKQKYSFRTGGNGVSTAALEKTADTMFRANHPVAGLVTPTADARADDVMHTLDRAATAMLSGTVRKLKQILSRHVNVSTQVIAGLIPELTYYIRWAEYIEKLQAKGYTFCKPEVLLSEEREMQAKGIYNLKLTKEDPSAIVTNDLDFDREHRI